MPGTQVFPREPDSVTNPNESFARNALGSVIDGTRQKILVFANSSIDVVGHRDYYRLEFDRIFFGAHCRRAAESHRKPWSDWRITSVSLYPSRSGEAKKVLDNLSTFGPNVPHPARQR